MSEKSLHPMLLLMRRRLVTNPFCTWLGVELVEIAAEQATLQCPWRDEFISNPTRQAVHGGVLAALVDTAAIYVVIASINRMAATVDLRIDYHGKPRQGPFTVIGTPVRIGRSLSTAEGRVLDCDGRLVASGRGVFTRLDEPIESVLDPRPDSG